MKKNKPVEAPEKKTWKKLVLIQTGDGYVSKEHYAQVLLRGGYFGTPLVEIDEASETDPEIIALFTLIVNKNKEISELKNTIKQYQEASNKIMGVS